MHKTKHFDPWNRVVPRLTPAEIRILTHELPSPNSRWKVGDVYFEVYRVKKLFDPHWPSEALQELMIHARGSYYIYGDRPPLDEYDMKAAPYLVRAKYSFKDLESENVYKVEEWLSDRLVPCKGEPSCAGELEYFIYQEERMARWLQTMYFQPGEDYSDYTFASNRMCAISPYFQNEVDEGSRIKLPNRQNFTALCYTLIRHHFLEDYLKNLGTRYYKTSILRNRVIERSMTVKAGGKSLFVDFTPAFQFLGLSDSKLIKIDRRAHNGSPYQFPGYFLDMDRLLALLRKLLKENKISVETLIHYLGDKPVVQKFLGTDAIHLDKLKNVGRLLSEAGRVFGSSLVGVELRALVDEEVPDGPELKISEIETLRKNCDEILTIVGATRQQ